MKGMMHKMKRLCMWCVPLMVIALLMSAAAPAYAQQTPSLPTIPNPLASASSSSGSSSSSSDTCTSFQQRFTQVSTTNTNSAAAQGDGLLSQIYHFIKDIVDGASRKIFENFTKNAGYKQAVYATAVLSVILFGVFFTIGLVQLTAGQLLVRLIKIAIIFAVISPGGWTFFSDTVVKFFNDGTDEIVMGVLQIATGGTPLPAGATPFYQLDRMGEFLINPDTLIAILGAFRTGPFGLGMGALMAVAFGSFLKMLIEALRIYAVSYVVRSLLLGLAPIFIVFMLFERTKQLFSTWLNSLISTALQPILLFTFFAFFTVMIESATKNLFNTELCYAECSQSEGSTNRMPCWAFRDPRTNELLTGENTWQGPMSCLLRDMGASSATITQVTGSSAASSTNCAEFPIRIIDILTFFMLVFLASRFAEVIDRVANELSSTFIALDPAGRFDQFVNQTVNRGNPGSGTQPPPTQRR